MILSFENADFKTENATAAVSDKHIKDGKNTLKICFGEGGSVSFAMPSCYIKNASKTDARTYVFCAFIYSEEAKQRNIRFSFGKDGETYTYFDVNVNFTGFRPICVKFEQDMIGEPSEDMDFMKISADEGEVWLARVLTCKMDPRYQISSFEVERVFTPFGGKSDCLLKPYNLIPSAGETEIEVSKIKEKYTRFLLDEYPIEENAVENAKKYLEMSVDHMFVTAIKRDIEDFDDSQCIQLDYYIKTMFSLAQLYTEAGDADIAELYIKMMEHLFDEGFACGSGFGAFHVLCYAMRMFGPSAFLMQKVIESAGIIEPVVEYMKWASSFGSIFEDVKNEEQNSFDVFNNYLQAYLCVALVAKSEKYLKSIQSFIEIMLVPTEGLKNMFKTDGCMYHHRMHYTIYGIDGLSSLLPVIYILKDTPFEIKDITSIEKAMSAVIFYSTEDNYYPVSMSGRHPTGKHMIRPIVMKYYKLLTKADETTICRDGHLTLNMACASFHRKNGVLMSIKGFSKYLWGSEIYDRCNMCGRHLGYGFLEIYNDNPGNCGYEPSGQDWAHLPGTTAIHFNAEDMVSKVYSLDNKSGIEEVLISDKAFAGACDNGKNGIFSFELSGHPKYDGSLRAKKSYIMHDSTVICIGSGICADDSKRPVHTTLYQQKGKANDKTDINGNIYYTGNETVFETKNQKTYDLYGKGLVENEFSTLYIDHGICPENASYFYTVETEKDIKRDVCVLRQDEVSHCVKVEDTTYHAIFDNEKFKEFNVSRPCIVMETEQEINVCIPDLGLYDEDPSQYDEQGNRVEVSIYSRDWIDNPVKKYDFKMEIHGKSYEFEAFGGEIVTLWK